MYSQTLSDAHACTGLGLVSCFAGSAFPDSWVLHGYTSGGDVVTLIASRLGNGCSINIKCYRNRSLLQQQCQISEYTATRGSMLHLCQKEFGWLCESTKNCTQQKRKCVFHTESIVTSVNLSLGAYSLYFRYFGFFAVYSFVT